MNFCLSLSTLNSFVIQLAEVIQYVIVLCILECENLGCNFIAWINYYVVSMGLLLNVIMQYTYFLKTNWGFLVCFYFLRHIMIFQFICISSLDGIGQISIVLLQEGVCQLQCY